MEKHGIELYLMDGRVSWVVISQWNKLYNFFDGKLVENVNPPEMVRHLPQSENQSQYDWFHENGWKLIKEGELV